MTPEFLIEHAIGPALHILPGRMDSREARAMMIAISLQESGLKHRRQIGGPAHGFSQFELTGVRLVMKHPATASLVKDVLAALDYEPTENAEFVYVAVEHNDILAMALTRLNLWWLPDPLPNRDSPGKGWTQYIKAWNPGKPRRETFDGFFSDAWEAV